MADNSIQGNRVTVWTRSTVTSTDWTQSTSFGSGPGSGAAQLDHPWDVSLADDGLSAFVADAYNHRVSVWGRPNGTSTDWTHSTNFGTFGTGADQLSYPSSIVVHGEDQVFVGDVGNYRISVWG